MSAQTLDELVAVAAGFHHRGATTGQAAGILTDLTGLPPDLATAMIRQHESASQPAEEPTAHEPSDDWVWC